ncbi:hypothetical protein CVT26_013416 [Gymnopilus dilepis]|uniref:Uncharacterized protein n=1 Tax=Gymnopilus dilepis TaxID=231916 RepID=A0A409VV02_9AGAR|nr:hypothetical protein CVT26_013416 [Gymnopilus dilepis]
MPMAPIPSIASAIERFVQEIISVPVDQPIDNVVENAVVAEHELRLLFRAGHQVPDLYLGLINIFALHPAARRTRARDVQQGTVDSAKHYILPLSPSTRRQSLTPSTVFNVEAFENHWRIFTHRTLSAMRPSDWDNVIAAGGSVLACLMAPGANSSDKRLNELFQSNVYASSDIDLFLWGLTAEQAEQKLVNIFKAVRAAAPWPVICVRRANVVSVHTQYPHRPIRIVLRLHQSPAEVLAGLDVDAACCAYNGKQVWVSPRGLAAIVRQRNTIDITRWSPSYETKLAKYAERGFEIHVPALDRERVKPTLYTADLRGLPNGLARLLVLEATITTPHIYTYLKYPKGPGGYSGLPQSEYKESLKYLHIPYGPLWDADKIRTALTRLEGRILGAVDAAGDERAAHKHIFFLGSMKQCIHPSCQTCLDDPTLSRQQEPQSSCIYIKGPLRFTRTNNGQQSMAGSFAPMSPEDWVKEAYEDHAELSNENRNSGILFLFVGARFLLVSASFASNIKRCVPSPRGMLALAASLGTVQILKQQWPHLITELLLSDELFDLSAEQMTQTKIKNLKNQKITGDLSPPQQVHTFYEAVGYMISTQLNKAQQDKLIAKLMELPNNAWDSLMAQAAQDMDVLSSTDGIPAHVLKTDVTACASIGSFYLPQLGRIYSDMLALYNAVSGIVGETVQKEDTVIYRQCWVLSSEITAEMSLLQGTPSTQRVAQYPLPMLTIPSIISAVQCFIQEMVNLPVDRPIDSILQDAIVAEHELRLLFGAGHQVQDLYLGLMNVFNLHPAARRTRSRDIQQGFADHFILPLSSSVRRQNLMPSTAFDLKAFQRHWHLFTHGALSKMTPSNWDHVIAAGGSVLACLSPPKVHGSENQLKWFQSSVYASSDIDLFLWGMTPEQAEIKMVNIYKAVRAGTSWPVLCVRRANTISIHAQYPYRPIQIILRLYQSPAEILAGFDIDAACCAYDGQQVLVNPRGLAAIVRQRNTIDITRRSPSYEFRLAKYAERGFEIYVPTLDRQRVRPLPIDSEDWSKEAYDGYSNTSNEVRRKRRVVEIEEGSDSDEDSDYADTVSEFPDQHSVA